MTVGKKNKENKHICGPTSGDILYLMVVELEPGFKKKNRFGTNV